MDALTRIGAVLIVVVVVVLLGLTAANSERQIRDLRDKLDAAQLKIQAARHGCEAIRGQGEAFWLAHCYELLEAK